MKRMSAENRIRVILGFFIFGLAACLLGMSRLAIFKADKYSGKNAPVYSMDTFLNFSAEERDSCTRNCIVEEHTRPLRGVIYDDQGRPLVSDVQVFPIGIDGRNFDPDRKVFPKDSPYLDTLISDLARAFRKQFASRYPTMTEEKYRERLSKAFKEKKRVQLFTEENVRRRGRMVSSEDIEQIRQLPVFCGDIHPEDRARYGIPADKKLRFRYILDKGSRHLTVRLHPYGDLAGRILGNVDQRNGIDGCATFDKILAGSPGTRHTLYVDGIALPLKNSKTLVSGGDVHTTLNIEIQKIVHKELMDKSKALKPQWACAIVMETATGDIKAITNLGRDTLNGEVFYREDRNYAMLPTDAEPGSTFKLASLLAYLEQTHGDTTRKYSIYRHTFRVNGHSYEKEDSHSKGKGEGTNASVKEIFQRSSNVGIAMMMRDAFPSYKDYVRKLDSLYITISCNAQIGQVGPLAQAALRPDSRAFNDQYPRYFGASFLLTPMQTLLYYNAVANDGRMMQPRFVKQARIGDETREFPTRVIREQIASAQTINLAKSFLKAVTQERPGTGFVKARDFAPDVKIAGKTGTRDIYRAGVGYDGSHNAISFCGYFPAESPKYTCIVYLYDVPYGSGEAVEVFAKIANQIMAQPQTVEKTVKHFACKHPVAPKDLDAVAASWGVNLSIPNGATYCKSKQNEPATIIPYALPMNGKVPDVTGLPAADAVYELKNRGFNISLSGFGIVKSQSYNPATNTIALTLTNG